jgi:uncharacterized damage-inducible protein DinB
MDDSIPSGADLLERADTGWASFRAAVLAIPEDEWDDEVATGGWSLRKMLNHIRVWHEVTAERLSGYIKTGVRPPAVESEDDVNARAAADADLRTRSRILDDLDRSYADIRTQVERLTAQQLAAEEGWAAAVVAGNTFGHYDEHRPDLVGF